MFPLVVFATLDSSSSVAFLEVDISGAAVSARSLQAYFDIEASLEALPAPAVPAFVTSLFLAGVDAIVAGDCC